MTQLLCDNFGYLRLLGRCPETQRNFLLATATPEQVHAICEVCHNLLRGVIPLSFSQRGILRRHAEDIRGLANSSLPFKTKKQILSQKGGGFIEDVVSPLMGTLSLLLI